MSGLLDGATVPWDLISGSCQPAIIHPLPEPVRREPTVPELEAAAAALDTAEAANWRVLTKVRAMASTRWARG